MPAAERRTQQGTFNCLSSERCAISHSLLNSNPTMSLQPLHKGAKVSWASGSSSGLCQPVGTGTLETAGLQGRSTGKL